ncbi:MAG: hypothetical protein F2567_10995, partial [Actinobacteria bacterium]|nr:hypothetical protein [Actinomycetota bacterium]
MVFSCWSAKGGSGTTVVSVALAVLLGQQSDAGSVYVDLEGDAPTVFGMPEPDGPGLSDWFAASESVGVSAIERLERPVANAVRLVPRGRREFSGDERARICIERLNADERPVVVDIGCIAGSGDPGDLVRRCFAEQATTSLLVTRPCFLSLRRALSLPLRPTGVVLIEEAGRALGRRDVEDVLGVPVIATIEVDAAVARAVDAGLLAARLPSSLGR